MPEADKPTQKTEHHQSPVHKPAVSAKPTLLNRHEVRTLLTWKAHSRPYRKRQRQYYVNILLIVLALEVILFLFSEYVLMLVVLSIAFVSFAFALTPPDEVEYKISTEGISINDHFYLWQELYDFYFKQRGHIIFLHVRTKAYLPGELIMLLGDVPRETMRATLLPFLPYREVVRSTFTEQAGDWIVKTFPLDKHSSEVASK